MSLSSNEIKSYLQIAIEASEGAGEVLKRYWGRLDVVEEKDHPGNLVTEADRESEKLIVDMLHSCYPTHTIFAEESGTLFADVVGSDSDYTWMVDPLDGTTNYTHQFPMVSISIALLYKGVPVVGVVYNPILKEFFHAAKGSMAYMNGRPIEVSKVSTLQNSLLVTGFAYDRRENPDNNYVEFCSLTQVSQGVRRIGSAAIDLAYVAAGRFDGYWERGLMPWDLAAGVLLVEQAGGVVSGYRGAPFDLYSGRILASNGVIHSHLSQALADATNSTGTA